MSGTIVRADSAALQSASALLRAGELVAFPTETVYGLGADAGNATPCARIFAAKGRPGRPSGDRARRATARRVSHWARDDARAARARSPTRSGPVR